MHFRSFAGRRPTREVRVGGVGIGGTNPIRVQSMITCDTMDTEACVRETLELVAAGCEIVRITAPTVKDAANLRHIVAGLRTRGCETPIVADIHFKPAVALEAAKWVEKVRVNPGNYADSKKFRITEYTDAQYASEIERIHGRFTPLVLFCREHGRAMRIGTNHGSLSDRIMNRYGDTPLGMVESALEFARIARDAGYHDFVFSMKSSNPKVMIHAYRLLVARLDALDECGLIEPDGARGSALHPFSWSYPIHLGVTEAGDGEDGRMKSAVGIGSLLADGVGDTLRVSLTEDSVHEIPVARALVALAEKRKSAMTPDTVPLRGNGRPAHLEAKPEAGTAHGLGGETFPLPLPATCLSANPTLLGWVPALLSDPFSYSRRPSATMDIRGVPTGGEELVRVVVRQATYDKLAHKLAGLGDCQPEIIYEQCGVVETDPGDETALARLNQSPDPRLVTIADTCALPVIGAFRLLASRLDKRHLILLKDVFLNAECGLRAEPSETDSRRLPGGRVLGSIADCPGDFHLLAASTNIGSLLCDGIGDAILIQGGADPGQSPRTAYNILQSAGVRIFKTDYVACPSCGRTLFNLQETTARIKAATAHLKGLKIAIMGCIVNGPGEMADADFGYVGGAPGKINLYVGKTAVQFNIPESDAVKRLTDLIREHGRWIAPEGEA